VNIAKTGSVLIIDSLVAELTPEERGALFFGEVPQLRPGVPRPWVEGSRLIGFYLRSIKRGIITPHGFHLYPVWLAIFYLVGGLKVCLLATPVLGLLGMTGLYLLSRRLLGPWVGLTAAFLLAINISQIWFARYPAAEMLFQFLLFAGLYTFNLMIKSHDNALAILSALCLGAIHFTKIEAFSIPLTLLLFFGYLWLIDRFRPQYFFFIATYSLIALHAAIHASLFATSYTIDTITRLSFVPRFIADAFVQASQGATHPPTIFGRLLSENATAISIGLLFFSLLPFGLIRLRSSIAQMVDKLLKRKKTLQILFTVAIFLLSLYAYYARPHLTSIPNINDRESLVRLGWYISPLGVLLGIVGFIKLSIQASISTAPLLSIAFIEAILHLYKGRITPVHFWAIRRQVSALIPSFMVFIGYTLCNLRFQHARGWAKFLASIPLCIALIISLIKADLPFLQHIEYAGAYERLSQLANYFPKRAILLFDWSYEGIRLTAPLQYIFDINTFFLSEEEAEEEKLASLVKKWHKQGYKVYWVSTSNDYRLSLRGYVQNHILTFPLILPEAEISGERLPNKVGEFVAVLDVYEIVPDEVGALPQDIFTLDIGADDQDYVVNGFYPPERLPDGTTFRWTMDKASLKIPCPSGPNKVNLLLRIGDGRPSGLRHARVALFLNERLIGNIPVSKPRTYRFSFPREFFSSDVAILHFETDTWNPQNEGISLDHRDLGLMVYWLKIEIEE
jgi:hypothetical protein